MQLGSFEAECYDEVMRTLICTAAGPQVSQRHYWTYSQYRLRAGHRSKGSAKKNHPRGYEIDVIFLTALDLNLLHFQGKTWPPNVTENE